MLAGGGHGLVDLVQGHGGAAGTAGEAGAAAVIKVGAADLQLTGAVGNGGAGGAEADGSPGRRPADIDVLGGAGGAVAHLAVLIGPDHGVGDIRGDGVIGNRHGGLAGAGAVGQGITGGNHHIGRALLQGGSLVIGGLAGQRLGVAVAAVIAGIEDVSAGAGAALLLHVVMAGGGDDVGLGLAAVGAEISLIAVVGAGGVLSIGQLPGVGHSKAALDRIGSSSRTAGRIAGHIHMIRFNHHHGSIAILDIARIHVGEIDRTLAATLGSEASANTHKVNRGIRGVFAGMVVAPQINDVVSRTDLIQGIHPDRTAGIVSTAAVDRHVAHNENHFGAVRTLCPCDKVSRSAGCTGSRVHRTLIQSINVVVFTLKVLTGTGICIGVGAICGDIGVMRRIGEKSLNTGINTLNIRGNGCKGAAIGVIHMVAAKNDQTRRICQGFQQRIQLRRLCVKIRSKENRIFFSSILCRVDMGGAHGDQHNADQQHAKDPPELIGFFHNYLFFLTVFGVCLLAKKSKNRQHPSLTNIPPPDRFFRPGPHPAVNVVNTGIILRN